MARMNVQVKINALAACHICLVEFLEKFLEANGFDLPQVREEFERSKQLAFQLIPEKEQMDFGLCYAGIKGLSINPDTTNAEQTATEQMEQVA